MATLTIEIDDRHFEELRTEADRIGVTVDAYVRTTLLRSLAYAEVQRNRVDRETFQKALAHTLETNDELYKRLGHR